MADTPRPYQQTARWAAMPWFAGQGPDLADWHAGTVGSIGAGLTLSASGTLSNAGVISIGGSQGTITLGANLTMTGNTLDGKPGTVTSIATGTGLTGGPITSTGTISSLPWSHSAPHTTQRGDVLIPIGGGVLAVSSVDDQIKLLQADQGTQIIDWGASIELRNTGVLAIGAQAGSIVLGSGLSMTIDGFGNKILDGAGLTVSHVGRGVVLSGGTLSANVMLPLMNGGTAPSGVIVAPDGQAIGVPV